MTSPAPLRLVAPGEAAVDAPEQLFRAYSRYVAAIAMRLIGRDSEVDDVVQEVFLVALESVDRMRDPRAVKGWLATVTVRIVGRKLYRRRLRRFVGLDVVENSVAQAHSGRAEDALLLSRVYEVLDECGVRDRLAWSLRHLESRELAEVAELCGCSLATAKRRIAVVGAKMEEVFGE